MSACEATAANCRCIETDDHEIHACECGGRWSGSFTYGRVEPSDFKVYSWPRHRVTGPVS